MSPKHSLSSHSDREALQNCFIEACVADVEALKPGNVSVLTPDPPAGMTAEDFISSAKACAADLCAPDVTLGERVDKAIAARKTAVKTNTNLGIVLLCAPLAHSAWMCLEKPGTTLRGNVRTLLSETTVDDACKVYQAINCANDGGRAGGMGRVEEQDLSEKPTVTLRAAMTLASSRDLIAAQYDNDFALLFEETLPYYLALKRRWRYNTAVVTGLYLFILGNYPDSLVARKLGQHKAEVLSRLFGSVAGKFVGCEDPSKMSDYLASCDAMLKAREINPGTTADITVASLFLANILDKLQLKTGEDYDN